MDIVERLMQQIETGPDVEDIVFINPDGPEAAAEIERLRGQVEFEKKCRNDAFDELKKQDAEIEQLREALVGLMEVQNGPPLTAWTNEWLEAMKKARSALQQKDSQ